MAGITGIIRKRGRISAEDQSNFRKMEQKLRFSDNQQTGIFEADNALLANVIPLKKEKNDRFLINDKLGVICLVDGYVHIEFGERVKLSTEYEMGDILSDYDLLPYLYKKYKEETGLHIIGSFNIFFFESKSKDWLLFNDRFGFLPFYYYEDDNYLVFGSKIESVLSSGAMPKIAFDKVSLAEHLYFHYILSENTYIKDIKTLANASFVHNKDNSINTGNYWDTNELFYETTLNYKESFDLIDSALSEAVGRCIPKADSIINFSLTGGWDSRVVLSYLLPDYKEKLNLYSFGAKDSDDITIPRLVSKKEGLEYKPFILDEEYLKNDFLYLARNTIELSGGTRNFKRTHYLYAIKNIGNLSENLITGIYGDEIFKVGRPQGGEVISPNTLIMIDDDFSANQTIDNFRKSAFAKIDEEDSQYFIEEFGQRIENLHIKFKKFKNSTHRHFAFRFDINLRKYFGNEAISYNDFVYCHSPFFDFEFIKNYARTIFAGCRYDYNRSRLQDKKQSTDLYAKLVLKRNPQLAYYPTARGYSMAESQSFTGKGKVIYRKYINKKISSKDAFYVSKTDDIFHEMLNREVHKKNDLEKFLISTTNRKTDALSLVHWLNYIRQQYQ